MRLPDVALDAAPARDGAAMRMRTRTNTVIAEVRTEGFTNGRMPSG
eukprot:CAMPEP_0181319922 /NCGR_PEP_ID=MMETSP1101-20121128/17836_1 /TAXON_ID=46948 /ORGANISM="Rhodomonas abbreviata, Strain Caron Lab Isolate" /LENGTH=45 /DNA_ID= /DNA_START= /DNA_END= /DNA_ORIENTATION=